MKPLKAVFVLIIVLGHISYYLDAPVFRVFHQLGAPAVAVFFFVSGFGLVRSFQMKGKGYLQGFFRSRILRILLPALVLFFVHLLLCGNGGKSFPEMLEQLFKYGITIPPQYWFLFVILFDYLLFWCTFRWLPSDFHLPVLFIGAILFIAGTVLAGYDRCWWICGLTFPTGAVFAQHEDRIRLFLGKSPLRFTLGMVLGSVLLIVTFLTHSPFVWTLSYVAICWIVALIVSAVPFDRVRWPVLGFLGTVSYEIYLSHITALDFLRSGRVYVSQNWLYILLAFALTLFLSGLVHFLCARLFPKR